MPAEMAADGGGRRERRPSPWANALCWSCCGPGSRRPTRSHPSGSAPPSRDRTTFATLTTVKGSEMNRSCSRCRRRAVRDHRLCERARSREAGRLPPVSPGHPDGGASAKPDAVAIAQSIASANSGVVSERPTTGGQLYDPAIRGPRGLCVGQAGCTEAGAEDDSIRITITVPDGWSGLEFSVYPSVERYTPPGGAGLIFMRGGWLYPSPPACAGTGNLHDGPTITTGTTVDLFVTALVEHPDLDVTSPVDVTLGGFSGQYLELRAPANTTTEELGLDPNGCGSSFVWEPGIYAQGPNALWRIWVLDVNGVRVVVRGRQLPRHDNRSKPNSRRSWTPSRSNLPPAVTIATRASGRRGAVLTALLVAGMVSSACGAGGTSGASSSGPPPLRRRRRVRPSRDWIRHRPPRRAAPSS